MKYLIFLILASCAHRPDALLQEMSQRKDQSYADVVMDKGPPSQREPLDERRYVAVWNYDYGTAGGHGSAQNIFGTVVYTQSPTYRRICKIMYFFEDDYVYSWRYEGYCK